MKIVKIILFLVFANSLFAQQDSTLISRHRPGFLWYFNGFRPLKDADNRKYDRWIIDFTYNDWVGAVSPLQNKWNSLGVNTNFMFDVRSKKNQSLSFGWGFAYGYSNVITDKKLSESSTNTVLLTNKSTSDTYEHNSIRSHRFYIPLELRIASKKWDRLKFIIGANVGIQPFVHQVFTSDENGKKQYFTNIINNRNLFSYGVHFRFGFRSLALFGSYQISPLFRGAESTKINPIQIGLSLSLF